MQAGGLKVSHRECHGDIQFPCNVQTICLSCLPGAFPFEGAISVHEQDADIDALCAFIELFVPSLDAGVLQALQHRC